MKRMKQQLNLPACCEYTDPVNKSFRAGIAVDVRQRKIRVCMFGPPRVRRLDPRAIRITSIGSRETAHARILFEDAVRSNYGSLRAAPVTIRGAIRTLKQQSRRRKEQ
jgi:hypothetical protein